MVRYCTVIGNKKMYSNSLDKARLNAIKAIDEQPRKEARIYQGSPGKTKAYGYVGFDVGRYDYYWIRGNSVYFLSWATGAVTNKLD